MSSYIKPVLVIGLNVDDINTKSIEELEDLSGTILYACNTGTENICFSFFNQMYEDDYSDAIFGFNINSDSTSFKAIDLGTPFDQEKINLLSKYFKEKIGLEPKFLASFERY